MNKFHTFPFLALHFPLLIYPPLLRNIHLFSSWTESLSHLWSSSFLLHCCLFVVLFISAFSALCAHFETAVSAPHAGVSTLTLISVIWSMVRPSKRKSRGCVKAAVLWDLPHFCHYSCMVWLLLVEQPLYICMSHVNILFEIVMIFLIWIFHEVQILDKPSLSYNLQWGTQKQNKCKVIHIYSQFNNMRAKLNNTSWNLELGKLESVKVGDGTHSFLLVSSLTRTRFWEKD